MSEQKACVTCGWFKPSGKQEYGSCNHPLVLMVNSAPKGVPFSLKRSGWISRPAVVGNDCKEHRPVA